MTEEQIQETQTAPALAHVGRFAGLDALRGLAICLVLIYHVAGVTFTPNGSYGALTTIANSCWTGVDIFFVLSGFLITSGLIVERTKRNYYKRFYIKRAFRLLPLYYAAFFLFLSIPLVRRMNPSVPLILCYIFYVQNLAMAAGHWIRGSAYLWSLGVEEQFYMFWPFICRCLKPRSFLTFSLSVCMGSFLLRVGLRYLAPVEPWSLYTFTLTRLDGIALGAAVALLLDNQRVRALIRPWIKGAFFSSLACLLAFVFLFPGDSDNLNCVTYLPFAASIWAASAVLYIVEFDPKTIKSSSLGKTLQKFGLYSYSIYVFHPFVLTLLHIQNGHLALDLPALLLTLPAPQAAGVTGLVFILFFAGMYLFGALAFRFIEAPLLRARQRVLSSPLHPYV